jgi:hypothetical protein
LCIISWLAWFSVACVVSKKFMKFLRKSLKKFDLNLKRNGLKLKFEKEKKKKKENLAGSPFSPDGPAARRPALAPAHLSSSPFYFFPASADTWAPPVSLPFPLSFLLLPLAAQPTRRRHAIPATPGHPPTFPSSLHGQLRQPNFPVINLAVTSHP